MQDLRIAIKELEELLSIAQIENDRLNKIVIKLQERGSRDFLTGLHNRAYFSEQLKREIARTRRTNQPLCFIEVDLDRFKAINDTHGHPIGDRVIKKAGKIFLKTCRESDIVCRIGGEEFGIILPETDLAGAYEIALRLKKEVEAGLRVTVRGGMQVSATISMGLGKFISGQTIHDFTTCVDQALYKAKKGGRNQIQIAVA